MSTKHTPGPWFIDTETRPTDVCVVHFLPHEKTNDQGFAYIRGEIGYWGADEHENYANAQLIAAAPELLAALKQLLKDSERVKEVMLNEVGISMVDEVGISLSRAAIAKAEGGAA